MLSLRSCLLVALAVVSGCSGSMPESQDAGAIEQAAQTWIDRFLGGDLDGLMMLYQPDAYVALHGQPAMRGVDTLREYFRTRVGLPGAKFEIDIEEIQVHGDIAHLVSKYWFEMPTAEGTYRDAGRSLLIYKRAGRQGWRIYIDIDQGTPDVVWPDQ